VSLERACSRTSRGSIAGPAAKLNTRTDISSRRHSGDARNLKHRRRAPLEHFVCFVCNSGIWPLAQADRATPRSRRDCQSFQRRSLRAQRISPILRACSFQRISRRRPSASPTGRFSRVRVDLSTVASLKGPAGNDGAFLVLGPLVTPAHRKFEE
jgi:hypothetical protein